MRHHWSSISETDSEISSTRLDPDVIWTPVVARISTHTIRLEREFNHNKVLMKHDQDGTHTLRALDMFRLPTTPGDHTPMIVTVYESPGKNYLRELVNFGPAFYGLSHSKINKIDNLTGEQIPLLTFLDFAIGACECLELMHHGAKAVHGEIRADAFHWNREKNIVKIVNGGQGPRSFENLLSSAGWSSLSRELGVKNKLQYMAPEQTGRLPAEPDSRTDIYSLGVLFWVLLTGRIAYDAEMPIDIVQKVLSSRLPSVSSIRMEIPDIISDVINKMTQKQMDERYHSVNGLKYDLIQIAKLLGEGDQDKLQHYKIGERDVSAFFILPSKTFGRHSERDKIFKIIEKVHKKQNSATAKVQAHNLYTTTSNSSVSESRLGETIDLVEGSDSSSSAGFKDSRSNSTTIGLENVPSKLNLLGLASKGIAEPRSNSWASSDGESQLSGVVSGVGMSNMSRRSNHQNFRRRGKTEVITLLGAQGVGKTHLIKSVQPAIRRHGYFAVTRFDTARPTPFEPLLKAMSSLFRQIFSEKDVSTNYHEMIRQHVRPFWPVLHNLLDLPESLIDTVIRSRKLMPQDGTVGSTRAESIGLTNTPSITAASVAARDASEFLRGPTSTRSIRFMTIYMDVLRIMCAEKVICLCLDDIHSADEESVELIINIIKAKTPMVFLLTSRLEKDMPHQTKRILDVDSANRIELHNLKEKHVFEYVAATMFQDVDKVIPLAAVVHEKSGGNPFLIKEILQACYQKECLWYDWRVSGWQFDLDKVFNEFASEQHGCLTSQFIVDRLQSLPASSRSILAWASLIGNTFSFRLIQKLLSGDYLYETGGDADDVTCPNRAKLTNISESDMIDGLQTLLSGYILVPGDSDDEYRFSHSRYLGAAHQMRECHNTSKMHFIIAQVMMNYLSQCRFNLYPLARHISKSWEIVKKRVPVRVAYRDVLWRGAQKAAESGATPTALWYYKTCIDLLQEDKWNNDAEDVCYDETLQLHVNFAELMFTQNQHEEALTLLQETFQHAKSEADKARSYILKGRILGKQGKFGEAFQCLMTSMINLGLKMEPTTWDECDIEFKKIEYKLRQVDRHELINRPLADDKCSIAMGTIASEALSMVWWSDSLLWYQLVLKFVNYHLENGASVQIGITYTNLSMIAVTRFKDVPLSLMFADISQEFLTVYDDAWTRGRGWLVYCLFIGHFQSPIRNQLPVLESALDYSLSSEDRNVSILNIGAMAVFRFWAGQDVAELEMFCSYGPEEFEGWEQDLRGGTLIIAARQLAKALQGKTYVDDSNTILDDAHFSAAKWLEDLPGRSSNSERSKDLFLSVTIGIYYHYGYYQAAADLGRNLIEGTLEFLWCHRAVASVYYYTALSLIALAKEQPKEQQSKYVEDVRKYKQLIDLWGSVHDVNYAAWSYILAGQIAELTQDYDNLISSYECAIDHCQVHGFAMDEALAIELQGEFILARGAKRAGKSVIQDAIAAWNRISCIGKARQLADKHEWLLKTATTARTMDVGCQTIEHGSIANAEEVEVQSKREYTSSWVQPKTPSGGQAGPELPGLGLDILDLTSILEFSRVISSELQVNALLSKMTSVILECCGGQAEFAAIVIDSEHGWCVAASGDHDSGVKVYPDGIPFADVDDQTAQHVTHYLLRTRETVFVHNVLEDERFSNVSDAYLARNPTGRSIIAIPIMQADHLMGVIHLEGKPNAFTQRNMIVLNLLTTQVSISLGNALLYRKVRKVSASNASMVESQKRALAAAREAEAKSKKAEAEAIEALRVKDEAMKAKSIFLANVSHELRTPLNGVIGMSELLKGTTLDKTQEGYADSIRICADTLLTVINDILDFSKLEAGKMQMFAVPLRLKETITEVVRALAYTNQEHGLETIEDLALDDGLVLGDPVRLHQIFMNLLSNAYKFTPHGSVTVSARKIAETRDKIKVTCSVADTGIGITTEQLSRLFQPFSQADSSTQRSYGGSGLGLSICKAMIENVLGGKIWIESTIGVGTTVSFTLTFQKAPKDSKVPDDMEIAAKDPDPMANWSQSSSPGLEEPKASFCDLSKVPQEEMRVCIAEDNAINRKIAISFVNKLGYSCEAFEDGKQAYEALQKKSKEGKPFHLVLMDVQMPVLDGYEATQAIRKDPDPNVREVLIIAMTASAIRGDREKCLNAGMNDYLAKPVRQAALKSMLNEYIHNPQAAIQRAAAETMDAEVKTNGDAKTNGHSRRPPFVSKKSGLSNTTNLSKDTSPPSGKKEKDELGKISGEDINKDGAIDKVKQKLVSIKDAADREARSDSFRAMNGEAREASAGL